ncbi:MAG: TrkA-N domain protein [Firmicutes bacterium]|nr:TrkA-N domain protein [Bacillota bacterium]
MPLERLKLILVIFVSILVVGTGGFVLIENMTLLEAIYLTVSTMSTVGYGDVVAVTTAGRIFTIFLIIIGVGMTYYALSYLIGMVVEGQLKDVLGRRGMKRQIEAMTNHIIVCGAGRVGENVIEQLRREQELLVVIENDGVVYDRLVQEKIPVVQGDSTLDEVLLTAGLKRAKGLITTLSHDADNVYVALTAKSLNPNIHVVARAERIEAEEKLRRAGADTVIFPSVMGGRRMVSAMTRPIIMDFVDNVFYNQDLHLDMAEIIIQPGASLVGLSLANSGIKSKYSSIVVAIKRQSEMITNPDSGEVLLAGDVMVVLGQRLALAEIIKIAKPTK